jgi:DNA-directed DNA polymerase III PolC
MAWTGSEYEAPMFTHLHVHSHYSLLDGASSPEALCVRAAELGYDALALTDTNGMYGALKFLEAARAHGVRPIFGVQLTASLPPRSGEAAAVVLAGDAAGFSALCRLVSARRLDAGFDLARALAGSGPHVAVLTPDLALARAAAAGRNGRGVYVELTDHSERGDPGSLALAAAAAGAAGLPVVAGNAVRFAWPDEHAAHRAFAAIRLGTTLAALPPGAAAGPQAFLKSPDEMRARFRTLPAALERAQTLAGLCRGLPPTGRFQFPAYPHCPAGESEFSFLSRLCCDGLRTRYRPVTPEAFTRLSRELAVIEEKHFAGYFLVVWDIAAEAARRGIPTVGRGSAANSIVSYALGITHVDPLAHGLFFERFLNPEREDPPDIDLDFPWDQRDEMLDYAYARFDPERVAMISTHACLHGRSAVREAGKVLGLSDAELSEFTRKLPHYGSVADVPAAVRQIPEARGLPLREEPWASVLKLAAKLDGAPRHLSVHPGGIVIAPRPVEECMPKEMSAKGVVVTQYDMYGAEDSGFVKIDLLGQRGLAVIRDAGRAVGVDWARTDPTRDPATCALLREGRSLGCFYVESPAMRLLLRKLDCGDFELLVAASSIIRPGVSNSGMMRMFIERHLGRQKVRYAHPSLKPILEGTYGVMVYQEDVIKVAHAVAGMSFGEADKLRRCMSKKRHWEKMETYRERFFAGARARGVPEPAVKEIWRQVESFGGYAFCKAHSASYAQLSFRSAYLKAHHPAEFMAAVLSNQGGFYAPAVYLEEARRLGLRLLPPDVNASDRRYRGAAGEVRVGLMAVKGLGEAHAAALAAARAADGPFRSVADLLERTPLTVEEGECLIACGACDGLGKNRAQLMWALRLARHGTRRAPVRQAELPLTAELDLPDVAGPDPDEALAAEFAGLELSPRAHPLFLHRARLTALAGDAVPARDLPRHAGRRVRAYGWLVTWRGTRVHKTGERMKFITLEDLTATFEVTLFPEAYRAHGHHLHGLGPYLVEGVVENDRGGVTLIAERIVNLGTRAGDPVAALPET